MLAQSVSISLCMLSPGATQGSRGEMKVVTWGKKLGLCHWGILAPVYSGEIKGYQSDLFNCSYAHSRLWRGGCQEILGIAVPQNKKF